MTMRIALAVELEVPDGTDLDTLGALEPVVKLGPPFSRPAATVVRWEVHPDPDAVFGDDE